MCKNLKLDFVFIFYNFKKFIMIVKLSTKISTNLAFVGFLLGLYSGFITRDEFYYNS